MEISNNPLPFLAINALCFALAWLVLRRSRFYRRIIDDVAPQRASMVDGLRGWLALGVFFTHVSTMHTYFNTGRWAESAAWFYGMTGQVGVSLFFMITGFLFWGRVLRSTGSFDAPALYVSRLRRIVPMYLVSVLMALLVAASISRFTLQVGVAELIRELRAWFSFGFIYAGDVNGVHDAHYINAVYWTLAFEWGFYVALPLLALLGRGRRAAWLFPLAFVYALQAPVTLNFIGGALAAILVEHKLLGERLKTWYLAPLPIAALLLLGLFPSAFALLPVGLMFIFFLFVVGGNSLFGLLASRPARFLGTISYSIYLVHCIVLYSMVSAVNNYQPIGQLGPYQYWLLAAAAALLAVLIASWTYRHVEHPFIAPPARHPAPLPDQEPAPIAVESR